MRNHEHIPGAQRQTSAAGQLDRDQIGNDWKLDGRAEKGGSDQDWIPLEDALYDDGMDIWYMVISFIMLEDLCCKIHFAIAF